MSVYSIGWLLNRLHPVIAATTQGSTEPPRALEATIHGPMQMVSNIIVFEKVSFDRNNRFDPINSDASK
jgi:hypothetical protein